MSVASLGLVSPGAATDGVTPIFPEKPFFVITVCQLSVLQCHPYLFSPEKRTKCLVIAVTFIDFTRESPAPFYLSDLVCLLFFVNSATIFFVQV